MTEPNFFVHLVFQNSDNGTPEKTTYIIATKYANAVKRELVKFELKSEGIDAD